MIRLCDAEWRLARVPHAGRDAVDRDEKRAAQPDGLLGVRVTGGPQAPKQLDLQEVDWIDIRIAHVDRSAEHGIVGEQLLMAGHVGHDVDGALQALAEHGPEILVILGNEIADRSARRSRRRHWPAPSPSVRSSIERRGSRDPSRDRCRDRPRGLPPRYRARTGASIAMRFAFASK
jgi:hypothetical protein